MAVDRAIDSTESDSKLTTVADAIRTAGGTTEPMSFPSGMVEAITAIQAGGGIELNGYQVSEGSFTISSDTSTFENYSTNSAEWPLVKGTNLTGKNFAFLLFLDPISVIFTSTVRVSLLFASASSIGGGQMAGVSEGFDNRTGLLSGFISKHGRKGVTLGDKETGTLKIYFGKGAPLKVGTTFHWFLFVEGAA